LNGSLNNSGTLASGLVASAYPVAIGNNTASTRQFTGYIDGVRIYNRALLTEEISAIYTREKSYYGL